MSLIIKRYVRYAITQAFWRMRFASLGRRSILYKPVLVSHPGRISIGAHTSIRDGSRLEVVYRPGLPRPRLSIGNHVNIEQGVHIVCQNAVVIEDYVSITPYCVIVDASHPFDDPDKLPKIGARLTCKTDSFVRIGRGSFIGAHSIILPNVRIGRGCIVGAGSVVTQDIPDFCVAAGVPAHIRRRFDVVAREWLRV